MQKPCRIKSLRYYIIFSISYANQARSSYPILNKIISSCEIDLIIIVTLSSQYNATSQMVAYQILVKIDGSVYVKVE